MEYRHKRLTRRDWERPPRLTGCHFGGGGGGTSSSGTYNPPSYTQPYWQDYLTGVSNLSQQPYNQYNGQQIAEMNPYQNMATDMVTQRALYGAPDLNAARGAATDIANGAYMQNPYLTADYTSKVIANNADTMANAYAAGTAAQTDAAYANQGAFGGSAYDQMTQANQANLAKQVGQMADQYALSAQGMGAQDYRSGIGNMLSAGQLAGGLSQDDWTAAQNLMGVGDASRQYEQAMLNANYNDWQQAQQYPFTMSDVMANALARASGGYGTNTGTTTTNYQASPFASLLGGGLAAYGLLGGNK